MAERVAGPEIEKLVQLLATSPEAARYAKHLKELDEIEDRVNHMKVPIEYAEHLYVLREHIEFVRNKLTRS